MLSHPRILHGFKKVEYFNWVRRISVNLTIERSNSIKTSKYDVVLTIDVAKSYTSLIFISCSCHIPDLPGTVPRKKNTKRHMRHFAYPSSGPYNKTRSTLLQRGKAKG